MMIKEVPFTESLRAWMKLKGETVESLADAANISKSAVGNILTGVTKTIRGSTRKLLATGLKIRPEDFARLPGPEDFAKSGTSPHQITEEQIIEDIKVLRGSGELSDDDLQKLFMRVARILTIDENENIKRGRAKQE